MKQTTRNLTSFFHWRINLPCALTGSNAAIGSAATCTNFFHWLINLPCALTGSNLEECSYLYSSNFILFYYGILINLLSLSIYTATCTDLTLLSNGAITYSPTSSPRPQGATATHSCNNGYVLSGGTVNPRVCQSDRTWSGGRITCPSKVLYL